MHTHTTTPYRINPGYVDALMGVATLLGDAGKLAEGLEFMKRALKEGGSNPDVYNNYGAYLLRLGKDNRSRTSI